MTRKIETKRDRGVYTITLADEDNRNALSRQLISDFIAAIDAAEADESVRVVVVTNRSHVFCAGADLKEQTSDESAAGTDAMADLFGRIIHSPKPFVGRIAGHAVAGGVGLAASFDISIAAADTKFGFTEVRVGVAPAIISVICLPKMPRAEGAAAFLRGNRFPAAEAARLGLINAAVPAAELDGHVNDVVSDLVLGSPEALAATKQLLTRIHVMEFNEALAWAAALSAELFAGPEAAEGMRAYLEKRRPSWVPEEQGGLRRED